MQINKKQITGVEPFNKGSKTTVFQYILECVLHFVLHYIEILCSLQNFLKAALLVLLYEDDLKRLAKDIKDGKIKPCERSMKREEIIVDNLLRDYTRGGKIIEYDGRKA